MKAVSIIGFGNSGKTHLMGLLAECFIKQNVRVAIIKHTHNKLDKPNTDTSRLMKPGHIVLGLGVDETVLFLGERRPLIDMLPLLDADLVLIEGGKQLDWLPRILCLRDEDEITANNRLADLVPELALACFGSIGLPDMPRFEEQHLAELAEYILEYSFALPALDCGACGQRQCGMLARQIVAKQAHITDCKALNTNIQVNINGQPLGLNPFTANMLSGTLKGLLSSLKGYVPGANITVTLK